MSALALVLLVLLIVLLIGGLPTWPHTAPWGWGYYPSGIIGVILIVLVVLLLMGRI
jgi:hypothetical protein